MCSHLDTILACDGQTDMQTDGRTDKIAKRNIVLCMSYIYAVFAVSAGVSDRIFSGQILHRNIPLL